MNTKAKGSRSEKKCKEWLEEYGYKSTKAGASLGTWDLIAVNSQTVLLIQCKTNKWPGKVEMKAMEDFSAPWGAQKLVVRYDDRAQKPRIKQWIRGKDEWVEVSHKEMAAVGEPPLVIGRVDQVYSRRT